MPATKGKLNITTSELERASAVPVREMAGITSEATELHVYLASTATAYGFTIDGRPADPASTLEREACLGVNMDPSCANNYEMTLIAARDAVKAAKKYGSAVGPRRIVIHSIARSVCLCAATIPRWRATGVYLTNKERALLKEAAWRELVAAIGEEAEVVFAFAENFTAARKRIVDLQAELRAQERKAVGYGERLMGKKPTPTKWNAVRLYLALAVDAARQYYGTAVILRSPWDESREDFEALSVCGGPYGGEPLEQLRSAALRDALTGETISAYAAKGASIFVLSHDVAETERDCRGVLVAGQPVAIIQANSEEHDWLLQRALREARSFREETSATNKHDETAFIEEEFGEEIERLMRKSD